MDHIIAKLANDYIASVDTDDSGNGRWNGIRDLSTEDNSSNDDLMDWKNLQARTAATYDLDDRSIGRLRDEFLLFSKNIRKGTLDTPEKALAFADAVDVWHKRVQGFMASIMDELSGRIRVWKYQEGTDDALRKVREAEQYISKNKLMDFLSDFKHGVDLFELRKAVNNGWGEEYQYRELKKVQEQYRKWNARVRGKARKSWLYLKDISDWAKANPIDGNTEPVRFVDTQREVLNLEGFRVVFEGFAEAYKPDIAGIKHFLKVYKQRAKKVFPWLLQQQRPLVFHWSKSSGDAAATYDGKVIHLWSSFLNRPERDMVKTLAHEMGHHAYAALLSGAQREAWNALIKGDASSIDLRDLVRAPVSKLEDLAQVDPVLYLQWQTLLYHPSLQHALLEDKEDIQDWLDDGEDPILPVPANPITGYAAKNTEEAFCETVGTLVAYGPRALLPQVKSFIRAVLPNIRMARTAMQQGYLYMFSPYPMQDLMENIRGRGYMWEYGDRNSLYMPVLTAVYYARWKKTIDIRGYSGQDNYIYQLPATTRIFDGSERDIYRLLRDGVASVEALNRYWGSSITDISDLARFVASKLKNSRSIGHSELGCTWNGFSEYYDGFTQGSSTYVWASVLQGAALVDGAHVRTQEGDHSDVVFSPPQWVIDELIRYTDDPGKRLKKTVKEWLKANAPKPYSSRVVYRGFGTDVGDWGSYSGLTMQDVSKKLYRRTGKRSLEDLRVGGPIKVKRGKESSWSAHPVVAKNFASGGAQKSLNWLVKSEVPASQVVIDFTALPYEFRKQFKYHGQAEVIVDTGTIGGTISMMWVDKGFEVWLNNQGYSFVRQRGVVKN